MGDCFKLKAAWIPAFLRFITTRLTNVPGSFVPLHSLPASLIPDSLYFTLREHVRRSSLILPSTPTTTMNLEGCLPRCTSHHLLVCTTRGGRQFSSYTIIRALVNQQRSPGRISYREKGEPAPEGQLRLYKVVPVPGCIRSPSSLKLWNRPFHYRRKSIVIEATLGSSTSSGP